MAGMNSATGRRLSGIAHLRQSIADILTTPIGSRVMRREYGSKLFELIDAPGGPGAVIDIHAAVAEALGKWEPRFRLTRVQSTGVTVEGKIDLTLEGVYLPEGRDLKLDGIVI